LTFELLKSPYRLLTFNPEKLTLEREERKMMIIWVALLTLLKGGGRGVALLLTLLKGGGRGCFA